MNSLDICTECKDPETNNRENTPPCSCQSGFYDTSNNEELCLPCSNHDDLCL